LVKNCNNINLVAASLNFSSKKVSDSKISLFSTSKPNFEDCQNIELGCFVFDYSGLSDVFEFSKLNIWDNIYSEKTTTKNSSISYINSLEINEFKDMRKNLKIDMEIAEKDYFSIPFTYGQSYDYKDANNYNMLLFIDDKHSLEEILRFCDPYALKNEECYLIKTISFKNDNYIIKEVINFNQESKVFFNRDSYIGMWIISKKSDNFFFLKEYLEKSFDGFYYVLFESTVKNLKNLIQKVFNFKYD